MLIRTLTTAIFSLTALSTLNAAPPQTPPPVKSPVDQTDVYAIPLDEDAEEEEEQFEELEKNQKK